MNRTTKQALHDLLHHHIHIPIWQRIGGNLLKLTKEGDCRKMAKNINDAFEKFSKLNPEQKIDLFGDKEYISISKETLYSWRTGEGNVSSGKNDLINVFLEQEDSSQVEEEEETPTTASSVQAHGNELKSLEGKNYWCYSRIMGASDSYERGGVTFASGSDVVIRSLFTFGKVRRKTIEVRLKNRRYEYKGEAEVLGNMMYIKLDDAANKRSFERNMYMGKIGNLENLSVISFLRLCLVDGEPRAVRLIIVEAEQTIDYETTIMTDEEVEIPFNDLSGSYREEIKAYLGDKSNVVLTTKPLTKNDLLARMDSVYNHLEDKKNKWAILSKFFKEYADVLSNAIESDIIALDILDPGMLIDFYCRVLEKMTGKNAMYATSLASREYLWQQNTINVLRQEIRNFLELGGIMVRFFFVNSLNINDLSEEQTLILTQHYNIYGNLKQNPSCAVYIVNQKKLLPKQKELVVMEKKEQLISWEINVERKKDAETALIKKIWITVNKQKSRKYAEMFDYFEECAEKNENTIVRKITAEDIAFWKNKFPELVKEDTH